MKIADTDLKQFFVEGLEEALQKQRISLQALTRIYIVDLLIRALRTEALFVSSDRQQLDEPLVLMFARALESSSIYQQQDMFQNIGDRSLYMSGFFGDHFNRSAVDIQYYMTMGARAYAALSSILQNRPARQDNHKVFLEMAEKFKALVDLIAHISESCEVTNDQDLLSLYERWLSTGSDRLGEKLRDCGISPIQLDPEKMH